MLAAKLTALQEGKGISNYRLAKELGVHQTSIASWKDGTRTPHPRHTRMIAEYFGITVDELTKEDTTNDQNQTA